MLTRSGTDNIMDNSTEWMMDFSDIESKFSFRTSEEPEDDLCYIVPGQPQSIKDCNFNMETQTFIVIHGWTVSAYSCLCHIYIKRTKFNYRSVSLRL